MVFDYFGYGSRVYAVSDVCVYEVRKIPCGICYCPLDDSLRDLLLSELEGVEKLANILFLLT